jgi:hypothetical protein
MNALHRCIAGRGALRRVTYDTIMLALYALLRLPMHAAAGCTTIRQGYTEFSVFAPMLCLMDSFFAWQHLKRLL